MKAVNAGQEEEITKVNNGQTENHDSNRKPFHISQQLVLFLSITAFVVAIGGVLIIILLRTVGSRAEKNTLEAVKKQTVILDEMIMTDDYIYDGTNASKVENNVQILANSMAGRIMIVNTEYNILFDTYGIKDGEYIVDSDVHKVMDHEKENAVKIRDGYITYIAPVYMESGEIAGLVIINSAFDSGESITDYMKTQSTILFVIVLILAAVFAFFMAYLSVRDVKKLKTKLSDMKDGHLETVNMNHVFSEVGELADDFNNLAAKVSVLEESRQEFVSNVSHELKTPITSMKVLSESLLMQENIPNEMYREFMNDIVQEIDREAQIINDLLTLVKNDKNSDSIKLETTDMNELMEVLLKRLKPLAEKRNIEVTFESFREVNADIDKVKFTLAISNLIENGIKYNVDGGWIRVSLNADHKNCYIKVADSGVGIPDDCIDHIFERFYRVDKARSRDTGGTGLGLAISRNIILMHKGSINVYSEPGKGTTFTVRVPMNKQTQQE